MAIYELYTWEKIIFCHLVGLKSKRNRSHSLVEGLTIRREFLFTFSLSSFFFELRLLRQFRRFIGLTLGVKN